MDKLGPKNQSYQFKLKLGTSTILNMHNSVVPFTFSLLDRKHPLWANMVQKMKLVSLSWNVVPRLIGIFRLSVIEELKFCKLKLL